MGHHADYPALNLDNNISVNLDFLWGNLHSRIERSSIILRCSETILSIISIKLENLLQGCEFKNELFSCIVRIKICSCMKYLKRQMSSACEEQM